MKRMSMVATLFAVISLTVNAIWPVQVMAAESPTLTYLGTLADRLSSPGTIELDGDGNIYVVGYGDGILKYNRGGELVATFRVPGVSSKGILVSPAGDRIYVSARDKVLILNADGEQVEAFGGGAGEFDDAGEIDNDSAGNIYVVDLYQAKVRGYDADGVFLGKEFSVASGAYNSIRAMAIDEAHDELYIADNQGSADLTGQVIRVYDLSSANYGALLRQVKGAFIGGFGGFEADDKDRIYLLDMLNAKMVVWGWPSTTLMTAAPGTLQVGDGVDTTYRNYAFSYAKDAVFDRENSRLLVIAGSIVSIIGVDNYTIPVMNEPPEIPQPISPIAGSEVGSANPTLQFSVPSDPDGDELTYSIEVSCGGGPALYAAVSDNSFQVPDTLNENQACTWRVQADDGKETSGWSDAASFIVNAIPEAPTKPVLDLPATGAVLGTDSLFSWNASTDADLGAAISYRLEVALDPSFIDPLGTESLDSLSLALDAMTVYPEIGPQTEYLWRVVAVDEDGLESEPSDARSFTVNTTSLALDANISGAKVYFGGNHAYRGRLMGETPFMVNHLAAGTYSVVVAYPGLQSAVGTVEVVAGDKVAASFDLTPAFVSGSFSGGKLVSGKLDRVTGQAAPFVVDFDSDGLLDILVGDSIGQLTLFPGLERDPESGSLKVGPKQLLDLDLAPGAVPFVVDWNNDAKNDLVVGTAGGSLLLLLNVGSATAPAFDAATYLSSGAYPINAGADAVPLVFDADTDGDKDLLVGISDGSVLLYTNVGTDALPELGGAVLYVQVDDAAAPFVADLDGDGVDELLVAAGTDVFRVTGTGSEATVELVYAAGGNGKKGLRGPLRLFVFDTDGKKGGDLVFGTGSGLVEVVRSGNSEISPSFAAAMNAKLDDVAGLLADVAPELLVDVDGIRNLVDAGSYAEAVVAAGELAVAAPATGAVAEVVAETAALLELTQPQ